MAKKEDLPYILAILCLVIGITCWAAFFSRWLPFEWSLYAWSMGGLLFMVVPWAWAMGRAAREGGSARNHIVLAAFGFNIATACVFFLLLTSKMLIPAAALYIAAGYVWRSPNNTGT